MSTTSSSKYSGFLPLPIHFPSTSKKSTQPHHLWIRPHTATKSSASSSSALGDLPAGRTLFIANLPIDIEERQLRVLFGEFGVVERVAFKLAESGQSNDPWENDSDSDEDMDSDGDASIAPTETGRKRKTRRSNLPPVTPLPALNPRHPLPYLPSSSACYLIYLDALSLTRCLSVLPTRSPPTLAPSTTPTGLTYYRTLHSTLRPSLPTLKAHADTSLALFDHHASLASSRSKKEITDEDGFTLVVRGGKYGRTAGTGSKGVGVASRRFQLEVKKMQGEVDAREGEGKGKERKKGKELEGFYKFQRNERRRQDLADLRKNFEADKEKVANLKAQRKFKPY